MKIYVFIVYFILGLKFEVVIMGVELEAVVIIDLKLRPYLIKVIIKQEIKDFDEDIVKTAIINKVISI